MTCTLLTAPTIEPLTISDIESHSRLYSPDERVLIESYIVAARELVETWTNRALITQTWVLWLDSFPCGHMSIPRPPLQAVTSITYFDEAGEEGTFSAENYIVDTASVPGRVALNASAMWPTTTLRAVNGVRVEFVAGYGDTADDVPMTIRQAMRLLVADWYENREATLIMQGITVEALPTGVDALLRSHRIIPL